MKMADLRTPELARRLRQSGVRWQTGPFTVQLRTDVRLLAEPLRMLYGMHPLSPQPWQDIADFHVRLTRRRHPRRWWRSQVLFQTDGPSPLYPFPLDHTLPLFEWGVNFCLASRANQYLLFHAGAVEKGGRVLVLAGQPGSGKSTLTAALSLRGWRLFSDEFAIIRPGTETLIPLARPIALKNQAIDAIRAFEPQVTLGPLFPKTRKGTVAHMQPPPACVQNMTTLAKPAWVVCPSYQPDAPTKLRPLAKSHGFLRLAGNAFNYELQGARGFKTVTALTHRCDFFELPFSGLKAAVALLDDLAAQGPPGL